jgi:hypothetical protein
VKCRFGDFISFANFENFEISKHRLPASKFAFCRIFIRKALLERGFTPGRVGLADAKAELDAASRWADCVVAYGDEMARP